MDVKYCLAIFLVFTLISCQSRKNDDKEVPSSTNVSKQRAQKKRLPKVSSNDEMPSFETMRVVLLGTGTPTPDPNRSKPAVAVIAEGQPYIVDFGAGVVGRIVEGFHLGINGLDILRLSRAFATHLHSDHTSGLSDLWLTPAAVGRMDALQVYGPKGIRQMARHLFEAYQADLSIRTHGLSLDALPAGYRIEATEIESGVVYEDPRVKVTAYPVKHGEWKHALAYRFDAKGRSIVISGDTRPTETIVAACNECDVLVHEVYCSAGFNQGPPGFKHYHSTSHTSTKELADIASRAKPKLLVLYHLLFFGCTEEMLLNEIEAHYDGEVVLGRDLDIF